MAKQSPGFVLQVVFSKANITDYISGLFGEQGLISRLETYDFEGIDQVSPLLGAIFDVFSGNENKALVIEVFTMYSNLSITLQGNLTQPCWTNKEHSGLAKKIRECKVARTKLFEKY